MIEKLLLLLRHKNIQKNGLLYLRRHYLTPRRWFRRLFLHLIKRPDDDREPHDHPWAFWTLVLKGGYIENIFIKGQYSHSRKLVAGDIVFRPAEHVHKVAVVFEDTWTLVLAGPSKRVWGFWQEDNTFVPWNEYLKREDGAVPEQLPEDIIQA